MPTRLLILSCNPNFTVHTARAAAMAGLRPIIATDVRWGHDLLCRHAVRRVRWIRGPLGGGVGDLARCLNDVVLRARADVVMGADAPAVRAVGACADLLDRPVFPTPPLGVFDLLNDKASLARWLACRGMPHPRTAVLGPDDPVPAWAGPCVVKPVFGHAGRLVRAVMQAGDLAEGIAAARTGGDGRVLVQEFVPGTDIDISVLCLGGEVVASTTQVTEPGARRFVKHEPALHLARAVCHASAMHGLAHLDLRLDDRTGQPVVIEINPRCWGSMAYSTWAGVNFVDLGVRAALGAPVRSMSPEGPCPFHGATWAGLRGRTPAGASPGALRFQRLDPLPELLGPRWRAARRWARPGDDHASAPAAAPLAITGTPASVEPPPPPGSPGRHAEPLVDRREPVSSPTRGGWAARARRAGRAG